MTTINVDVFVLTMPILSCKPVIPWHFFAQSIALLPPANIDIALFLTQYM